MNKKMTIAIDFDGTCITNDFPEKGKDIGAVPVLKKMLEAGHNLILYTCRQDHLEDRYIKLNEEEDSLFLPGANHLTEAVEWFNNNNIPLVGVNYNPDEFEYETNKPYFDLLIDDKALGIPTTTITIVGDTIVSSKNPFVEWQAVELMLMNREII